MASVPAKNDDGGLMDRPDTVDGSDGSPTRSVTYDRSVTDGETSPMVESAPNAFSGPPRGTGPAPTRKVSVDPAPASEIPSRSDSGNTSDGASYVPGATWIVLVVAVDDSAATTAAPMV